QLTQQVKGRRLSPHTHTPLYTGRDTLITHTHTHTHRNTLPTPPHTHTHTETPFHTHTHTHTHSSFTPPHRSSYGDTAAREKHYSPAYLLCIANITEREREREKQQD